MITSMASTQGSVPFKHSVVRLYKAALCWIYSGDHMGGGVTQFVHTYKSTSWFTESRILMSWPIPPKNYACRPVSYPGGDPPPPPPDPPEPPRPPHRVMLAGSVSPDGSCLHAQRLESLTGVLAYRPGPRSHSTSTHIVIFTAVSFWFIVAYIYEISVSKPAVIPDNWANVCTHRGFIGGGNFSGGGGGL